MEWKYSCPKCTAILNPGKSIILLGHHDGVETLLAFHPEPGNYELGIPYNITINKGETWDFACPVCHGSLNTEDEENLAGLDMTDGYGSWHKVIFSRVAGEQATFVIGRDSEETVEKFGTDLTKYEHYLWHKYI
ncbi:MAG: hypothetical protein KJ645_14030 [Planctomycetes bacterium]|nr:hypothetical protein [Planctomycetota bacterium]